MSTAYSELYLDDAMKNMGEMTEYGEEACGVNQDLLLQMFVVSGYAQRWEKGDPLILSGRSGTELCRLVLDACSDGWAGRTSPSTDFANIPFQHSVNNQRPSITCFNGFPDALVRYDAGDSYWRGYILALCQWKTGYSFSKIIRHLHMADLQRMYPAYHTSSDEKAAEELESLLTRRGTAERLQMYRKRLNLSQQELADRSGINLRTLQEYEVGRKDLRKAGAEKVLSLSKALWCKPEEIL